MQNENKYFAFSYLDCKREKLKPISFFKQRHFTDVSIEKLNYSPYKFEYVHLIYIHHE